MKHFVLLFGIFTFFAIPNVWADDDYDFVEMPDSGDVSDAGDIDTYDITTSGGDDIECALTSVAINADSEPIAVANFDIAGIMVGMSFEDVQIAVRENGLYVPTAKNNIIYSLHQDWRDNLDYECRQRKIFAPKQLENCIRSLAKNRGLLYASEMHLIRERTGETIDVYFTSNATDNTVWKIVYKNDVNEVEGDAKKFAVQRERKIMAFWQNILDKYGVPNSNTDKWVSSDNAYDPMMTAYYGQLELTDCGRYADDDSKNTIQAKDNFVAKPYAF